MILERVYKYLLLMVAYTSLQGCVGAQSFPGIARGGDTITIAAGSHDGMNKSNTSVIFISDVDSTVTFLPIRAIVKIRPDNTSEIATFDNFYTGNVEYFNSHSPWLSLIVLDLPQGLTIGTGEIRISTSASLNVGANVNQYPIDMEIIPGIGSSNSFDYFSGASGSNATLGDISKLEPQQQVVIRPPVIASTWANSSYGGAEIKVNIPTQTNSGSAVPSTHLKLVQDDMYYSHTVSQTRMFWSKSGSIYTVQFISPKATMKFYQPRFSLVLKDGNEFVGAPQILSVNYFDANGNIKTAGTPTKFDYSISVEHVGG